MHNRSVWEASAEETSFPQLNGNVTVDVAIIGGGITGITAAYLLSKAGKNVAVLEAWKVGGSSTGHSTGNLYCTVGDDGLQTIQSKFDAERMEAVGTSHSAAVDFIEQRVQEFSIDCDFRRVPWCLFTDGTVLEGPAYEGLEKYDTEAQNLPLHLK